MLFDSFPRGLSTGQVATETELADFAARAGVKTLEREGYVERQWSTAPALYLITEPGSVKLRELEEAIA